VCPEAHDTPHAPQFWALLCVSTQLPLQSTVPEGHEHRLLAHTRLPAQICEQNPQLFLSSVRSTQELLQRASPEAHWTSHVPLLQTRPMLHAFPHEPQSFALLVRSTQVLVAPPPPPPILALVQAVSPLGHTQALEVHDA
jgi:hypothetical protein